MSNWFNKHLKEHNIGYVQHLVRATLMGSLSLIASIVLLIHAIFPFLFLTTGSNLIKKIHDKFIVSSA